jgi:O-antigen ligase
LAYVVAPASLLLVCLWAGPTIERRVVRSFEKTADEGHQGSTRVELWKRGFRSFLSAPVFGLGPGPHAGDERVRGEEAHNTMIDWAASTGIVGLSAYLALLAWVGIVTWRSGNELLISGFIALLCFSSFHYVLRHPIYWQQLLAIAAFALPPAPVAVSSRAALPARRPRFTASASGARSPAG